MKFMKKLSLFVALALLVTIGGVYAAWIYPADNALVGSATKTFTGNMTSVETSATSKGEIYVDTANDTLKIYIDDAGNYDSEDRYQAMPIAQGSIDVYFRPLDGVSSSIENSGIPLTLTVAISGTQTTVKDDGNHDVKIFTVGTATLDLSNGEKQATGVHAGAFKVTITGQQILDMLNFCKDGVEDHTVTLDTLDENKAFGDALNTYTINLTISEKTA